jgi:glycosyltransferase involved in cell wall biosynthesis
MGPRRMAAAMSVAKRLTSHRASIAPVPLGTKRPLWSVMIPTFNCASYLGHTLRSVLAQAPGPEVMQIEVIDDASSRDDPAAVVRAVGGGRVEFVRQPRNVGHIRNFETCLRRARGHYVHLLHGDDFVLPGFYTALQAGFESSAAIGAAFCRWVLVDGAGEVLSVAEPQQDEAGPLADAAARLAEEQHIVTPSIAVRRSAYEALGGFDDRLRCSEDWEMWVRIAARYPVWYEPKPLAAYRTHADSNTGRNYRLAEELRYTGMAIEMFGKYLPRDRVRSVTRKARRAYARTALENARRFAERGDREGMRAHLRAALRLSRAPRVLIDAARLLSGRGGS